MEESSNANFAGLLFKLCAFSEDFSQRKAVKIHLCLSILLNVIVIASSAITFGITIADQFQQEVYTHFETTDLESESQVEAIMIVVAFCLCYSIIGMTMDCLAMIGIHHVNAKLLLPWLLWCIFDAATLITTIVVVIVYTQNAMAFLLFIRIIWNAFIWINLKALYQEDYLTCQEEVLY
ncbi:hypothetical protein TCAL_15516 [Tigriopus californicus]|uniref:Uncharacterized protein n=1 Tax=Tigriopus californicus TaxID=6832 RepID=A0A553PS38_TIGCA|nr:uncharacterized protein LOC131892193 [Tigriopus californicus]TRY80493.1 hypothetical protein TCAL_15516 [Tigriopus californicus]